MTMEYKADDDMCMVINNNCKNMIENEFVEIMFSYNIFNAIETFIPNDSISLDLLRKSKYFKDMLIPYGWYRPIITIPMALIGINEEIDRVIFSIVLSNNINSRSLTYRLVLPVERDEFLNYLERLDNNDPNHSLYLDRMLIDYYVSLWYISQRYFIIIYNINMGAVLNNFAKVLIDKANEENEYSILDLELKLRLYALKHRSNSLETLCIIYILEKFKLNEEELREYIHELLIYQIKYYRIFLRAYDM